MPGMRKDRRNAGGRLAAVAAGVMLLVTLACTDRGPTAEAGPMPGELEIGFSQSAGDVGAVLFTITGGEVGEVAPVSLEHRVFSRRAADGTVSVVVVGEELRGALVRFRVPDVRASRAYHASISEIADREDRLADELDAYAMRVSAVER